MALSLNSQYIAHTSRDEAYYIIAAHRKILDQGEAETELQELMLQRGINELKQLIDDLGSGKAVYEARYQNSTSPALTNEILREADAKELDPEKYPKQLITPEGFEAKDRVSLSPASYETLSQNRPTGSIEPAMRGGFFTNEELLVPRHDGYTRDLGFAEWYPIAPRKEFAAPPPKTKQVRIQHPGTNYFLPMPIKAEPATIQGNDIRLSSPTDFDPLIWRVRDGNDGIAGLDYCIQELDETKLHKVDITKNPDLLPSDEEQQYWQQALPLPSILQEKIAESPKDLIRLLVSYLGIKDKESGLTNFRYSANAEMNEFLEQNKEHLPLIVSELKTGHCDTLSWYLAALIRSFGKPAWISRGLVTANEGSQFQDAYGHSVVITTDETNKLIQIDPTIFTQPDPAYLPEEFPHSAFNQLKIKFGKAKFNRTRIKYLREFSEALSRTRTTIQSSKDRQARVRKQLNGLQGHFDTLSSLRLTEQAGLNNQVRELSNKIVNYTANPNQEEFSSEEIFELLPFSPEQGTHFVPYLSVNQDPATDTGLMIADVKTKVERENIAKALEIFKKLKLPYLKFYEQICPDPKSLKPMIENQDQTNTHKRAFDWDIHLFPRYTSLVLQDLIRSIESSVGNDFSNIIGHISQITAEVGDLLGYQYSQEFTTLLNDGFVFTTFSYMSDLLEGPISFNKTDLSDSDLKAAEEVGKDYIKSLLYFLASFQRACVDQEFKKAFLRKFDKDHTWFMQVCNVLLDMPKPCASLDRKDSRVYKKFDGDFFYPYYIEADDQAKLAKLFKKDIARIDYQHSPANVVEADDLREYSPGDDARRINWKATARSSKVFVNSQPRVQAGINTPLHVLIHITDTVMARMQMLELVKALQRDSQKSGREIYMAFQENGHYTKIRTDIDPRVIVSSLFSGRTQALAMHEIHPGKSASYLNFRGRPISNLLYISHDYNHISAMKHIYSGLPRNNLSAVYLREEKYDVYPLLDKKWVEANEQTT